MTQGPDLTFEKQARMNGASIIAGVDEAGRGPLAGPVVAAAVIVGDDWPEGLNDSKKLTAKRRFHLAEQIMDRCIWAIGRADVDEIEQLNIYHASHLAMCRAVDGLAQHPAGLMPDLALIDGPAVPTGLRIRGQAIVKGDALSLSIAAASILAKTHRDRIMEDLAQHYPGYGWEKNAGYPTKLHKQALLDLGVTPHHRRGYAPVHNILCKEGKASC